MAHVFPPFWPKNICFAFSPTWEQENSRRHRTLTRLIYFIELNFHTQTSGKQHGLPNILPRKKTWDSHYKLPCFVGICFYHGRSTWQFGVFQETSAKVDLEDQPSQRESWLGRAARPWEIQAAFRVQTISWIVYNSIESLWQKSLLVNTHVRISQWIWVCIHG